jgi:hypothetical protein
MSNRVTSVNMFNQKSSSLVADIRSMGIVKLHFALHYSY